MNETQPARPFALCRHDLGDGCTLVPMTPSQANETGAMCAGMEPWRSYPFSTDELIDFFASQEPHAPRFAALRAGRLAGALAIKRDWFRGPYVHLLVVAPDLQGRGLGTALLAFAEREARSGRERNLWIAATATNTRALRHYARYGFSEVAHLDGLVRDGVTEVLMRKLLLSPTLVGEAGRGGLQSV